MAWSDVGAGAGVYRSSGSGSVWLQSVKTILAELCYATNEREILVGRGDIDDDGTTTPSGQQSSYSMYGLGVDWSEILTLWPVTQTQITTATVASGATSFDVEDASDLVVGDWIKVQNSTMAYSTAEIMKLTGKSGDTLTVTRAQKGTSAQTFSAGHNVYRAKTFPAAADFSPAEVSAKADRLSLVKLNLQLLQDAIDDILDGENGSGNGAQARYTDAGYTVFLTLAGVLGPGSYGSSWLTIARAQDGRIYEQIREALEEMTQMLVFPIYAAELDDLAYAKSILIRDDWEGAYDFHIARGTNAGGGSGHWLIRPLALSSPFSTKSGNIVMYMYRDDDQPEMAFSGTYIEYAWSDFYTGSYYGSVDGQKAVVTVYSDELDIEMDIDLQSPQSGSVTIVSEDSRTVEFSLSSAFPIGTDALGGSLGFETTMPANCPVTDPNPPAGNTGQVGYDLSIVRGPATLESTRIELDISAELTYG